MEPAKKRKQGVTNNIEVIPPYTYKAYVELVNFIPAGTPKMMLLPEYKRQLGNTRNQIHRLDESVCILKPVDDPLNQERIYKQPDIPDLYRDLCKILKFENGRVFLSATGANRSKKVVCSALMGFSADPRPFLEAATVDLSGAECEIKYKLVQAWDTSRRLMLLYAPNMVPPTEYSTTAKDILQEVEKKIMRKYPTRFPACIHDHPFPTLECTIDWARGTPYIDRDANKGKDGRQEDTSFRKVATFHYETEDEERLLILAREAKMRGMEAISN